MSAKQFSIEEVAKHYKDGDLVSNLLYLLERVRAYA